MTFFMSVTVADAIVGNIHSVITRFCPHRCLVSRHVSTKRAPIDPNIFSNSGNYYYLFESALFWLSILLVFFLSILPRYFWMMYQITYMPTDVDVMRLLRKRDPSLDFARDPKILAMLRKRGHGTGNSVDGGPSAVYRQSADLRGSRVDMATGVRSQHHGFDFATEEHGVAMQRIQSHLSEKRVAGG